MIARLVPVVALALLLVAAFLLLAGDDEYRITAEFENAGQLVDGNEVIVGGATVGKIKDIDLGPNGQALVTFSVDRGFAPLREGTIATVRSPSLSQVAGRQIELTLPAEGRAGEEIPDGGTIRQEQTVSTVDLDQIFNTLDRRTVRNFKRVIQGFEQSIGGVEGEANRGFRYFNPLLSTSRQVFAELAANDPALERLIVDGAKLSGTLAERGTDLSAMVGNLNRMMNAIGDRKERLARSISLLPGFMRRANTTFVNLRAALDDVDPLVEASIPAVRELGPFLRELRPAARDAVPTIRDFATTIKRPGGANDLIELQKLQPRVTRRAIGTGSPDCGPGPEDPEDLLIAADGDFGQGAFGEALCSLTNGHDGLAFFRAYTPELVGWFDTFSHSGYSDALGGIGRISTTFNTFNPSFPLVPNLADLLDPDDQLAAMSVGNNRRCPGANERPLGPLDAADDSVPFTDAGALTDGSVGQCDPTQVAPGP